MLPPWKCPQFKPGKLGNGNDNPGQVVPDPPPGFPKQNVPNGVTMHPLACAVATAPGTVISEAVIKSTTATTLRRFNIGDPSFFELLTAAAMVTLSPTPL